MRINSSEFEAPEWIPQVANSCNKSVARSRCVAHFKY